MVKSKQSVYQQIATDIASRIARNELEIGHRMSGRSVMSSEYGVSPETVRRAMNLLKDEGVVDVISNTGVEVKSKAKAIEYLKNDSSLQDVSALRHQLDHLMSKKRLIEKEIESLVDQIVDLSSRFSSSDLLSRFEYRLDNDSHLVGKSVKDLRFFQNTGMTIVAISRNGELLLTPGPDAVFEAGDTLILMGHIKYVNDTELWLKG